MPSSVSRRPAALTASTPSSPASANSITNTFGWDSGRARMTSLIAASARHDRRRGCTRNTGRGATRSTSSPSSVPNSATASASVPSTSLPNDRPTTSQSSGSLVLGRHPGVQDAGGEVDAAVRERVDLDLPPEQLERVAELAAVARRGRRQDRVTHEQDPVPADVIADGRLERAFRGRGRRRRGRSRLRRGWRGRRWKRRPNRTAVAAARPSPPSPGRRPGTAQSSRHRRRRRRARRLPSTQIRCRRRFMPGHSS